MGQPETFAPRIEWLPPRQLARHSGNPVRTQLG